MKNESSRHIGIRIPKRIFDLIEEHYPNIGWSQIVREALAEKLERDTGEKIDRSFLEMTQGARNDLPNRITEAEKRSRKGTRPRGRPRKTLPVPPIPPVRNVRINPDGSFSPVSAPPEAPPASRQSAA